MALKKTEAPAVVAADGAPEDLEGVDWIEWVLEH
jgi:hypothetical protein